MEVDVAEAHDAEKGKAQGEPEGKTKHDDGKEEEEEEEEKLSSFTVEPLTPRALPSLEDIKADAPTAEEAAATAAAARQAVHDQSSPLPWASSSTATVKNRRRKKKKKTLTTTLPRPARTTLRFEATRSRTPRFSLAGGSLTPTRGTSSAT